MMSATRLRRARPANLKIPAGPEPGRTVSFKLLCRHGASWWPRPQRPPCLTKCHDTLQHFPGPAGEKKLDSVNLKEVEAH